MAESGKAFNLNLFKRLLGYTNNYKGTFLYVALAAVLISVFGVLRPLIMQKTIDESIVPKDMENLIFYIVLMIGVLILEVIFMLTFIFFTNWLGQSVIRDIREKLFKLMLSFKQKYYDTSAVGRLTTRAVNDIETISSIFSQGLFVIISDLLKMVVIMGVMLYKSWQLTLIVFSILPISSSMSSPEAGTYLKAPLALLTTHQPPAFLPEALAYPANCPMYPKPSPLARVS